MNDAFVVEYSIVDLLREIDDRHVQSFLFKFLRASSGWISLTLSHSYSFLLL